VALVVGLWTGSQVFLIMELVMGQIWHAERRRPFWQSRLLALLMLVISVTILLITVGLQYVIPALEHWNVPVWGRQLGQIRFVSTLVGIIVPLLLSTLLFGAIYRILPLRKVTWHSALPGAMFSAIVWMVFIRLFGFYAVEIARYSIVYGTLGNPVLLISLFYFSALIMLVGAEIAAIYHQRLLLAGDAEEQRAEIEER
jgi:membrane protein